MIWQEQPPLPARRLGPLDWLRVVARVLPLLVILAICFPLLLVLRLPERAIWGLNRPVTPWITQGVCIAACWLLAVRREVIGRPMVQRGAFVANHVSWLDIFVLNASKRLYFVAKAEVRGWGGIGWLARGTGTLFIARRVAAAKAQQQQLEARLAAGHKLLFFPEGTSTNGFQVLPFKTTLFAALFTDQMKDILHVQPVSLRYVAPVGDDAWFYGWWGDMAFGPHLLQVLASRARGRVTVTYLAPLKVADFTDRKALAAAAEAAVRSGAQRAPCV
jgi:1-acyl-sn-glycerol-3-phosphate acyltransferase